jgi:cysteinyl-tRNA synthetase
MRAFTFEVMGLDMIDSGGGNQLDAAMDIVLELRKNAREQKDWGTSDLIRDKLKEAGITVKDSAEGSSWTVN